MLEWPAADVVMLAPALLLPCCCHGQVGVLGGVIGAHSCRGQGSMFWFKIPTFVRQAKSRSTDSNTSQQRSSLEQQQASREQPLPADTTATHKPT